MNYLNWLKDFNQGMHTIDVQSIYKKYFYEFLEFLKYF